jgi:hypothetical protein
MPTYCFHCSLQRDSGNSAISTSPSSQPSYVFLETMATRHIQNSMTVPVGEHTLRQKICVLKMTRVAGSKLERRDIKKPVQKTETLVQTLLHGKDNITWDYCPYLVDCVASHANLHGFLLSVYSIYIQNVTTTPLPPHAATRPNGPSAICHHSPSQQSGTGPTYDRRFVQIHYSCPTTFLLDSSNL